MPYQDDEYMKIAQQALAASQTIPSIQPYQGSLDDMARDMNTAQMIQSGRRQTAQEQQQNISNLRTQLESNTDLQNQARDAFTKMQTDYTNLTGRTDYQDAIQQNLKAATRDQYDDLAEQILSQYNSRPVPSIGSGSVSSGNSRRATKSIVEEPKETKAANTTKKDKKALETAQSASDAKTQLDRATDLVVQDAKKNGKVDKTMYDMLTPAQKKAVDSQLSPKTDSKKTAKVQAGKLGPSDLEAEAYNPKVQKNIEEALSAKPANAQAKVPNAVPEEPDNTGRLSIKDITTGAGLQRQEQGSKIDRWADPSTKIRKEEEAEAEKAASDYIRQNVRAGRFVGDPKDLEDGTAEKMSIISAKTNPVTAFTNGLVDSFRGVGRVLDDLTGNVVSNTINRLSGKTAEEAEEFNQSMTGAARTQHPIITGAGTMGGKMLQYAGVNSALEALGVTPALEAAITGGRELSAGGAALAGAASRLATGELADIALDTIPTEYENLRNGMSPAEVAQDTLKNLNTNLMYNIGGEVIGQIPSLFRGADPGAIVNDGSLRGITESVQPDAVNIPKLENAANPLENVSNAMRNLDDIANQTGDVYAKQGVQQLSDALANGENIDEAANALKQTLQHSGVDGSTVDAVTQNLRTYDNINNSQTASTVRDAIGNKDIPGADEAIMRSVEWDEAARRYADGEISTAELEQARKNARNAISKVQRKLQSESVDPDEIARVADEAKAIRQNFGIMSEDEVAKVAISKEDLRRLTTRGKQSDTLERLNKSMKNSGIQLTTNLDEASAQVSGTELNDLISQASKNSNDFYTAHNPETALNGYVKRGDYLYQEYQDLINQYGDDTIPKLTADDVRDIEELFGPHKPNIARPANQATEKIPSMNRSVAEAIDNGEDSISIDARQLQQEMAAEEIPSVRPSNADADFDRMAEEVHMAEQGIEQPRPAAEIAPQPEPIPEGPEGKRLSRMYNTLQNTETLSDAEKATYAKRDGFWYDPDNERQLAQQAQAHVQNDLEGTYNRYMTGDLKANEMSGEDLHNMYTTSFTYNKMAQEAKAAGNAAQAAEYANKAENIMLAARKNATAGGQFNAAIRYYARTAQGAVQKSMDMMSDAVDKFVKQHGKAQSGIEDLSQKLAKYMTDHNAEAIMNGTDEGAKIALRADFTDAIQKMLKGESKQTQKALRGLSMDAVDKILMDRQTDDIVKHLDFFASSGSMGVKADTIDAVEKLFDEASQYNFNSKDYVNLESRAYQLLANDLGAGKGFKDKFDQWRYMMMLANPTTHIRNMTGNLTFGGLVGIKNNVAAAIEQAADYASRAMGGEGIERTKSFLTAADADLVKAARQDALDNAYRQISGNKYYDVGDAIEKARKTWSDDTAIGKALNQISDVNANALGAEDEMSMVAKYQTSLAGYLKANGHDSSIFSATDDASKQVLENARAYALHQAEEAAFHQKNAIAENFGNFTRTLRESDSGATRLFGTLLDVTVPFKKTPANIVSSIYQYSPASAITLVFDLAKFRQGAMSAADFIDDIAKTATGTAALAIGAALAHEGIVTVGADKSDKEKNFDKATGVGNVSIHIGNKSIGIGDLAPASAPIIIGATMLESARQNQGEGAINSLFTGLGAIADSVTDMTMLSGLSDVLTAARSAQGGADVWTSIGTQTVSNLASQMLPTLGRKIETSIDPYKRSTYSDKTGLSKKVEQSGKYLTTKIPGLQALGDTLEARGIDNPLSLEKTYDVWGREVENTGGSFMGRLGFNLGSPVTYSDDTSNARDNELRRLADSIGDDSVIPEIKSTESEVNGAKLSPEDWSRYQQTKGQLQDELTQAFIDSEAYQNMDDAERAELIPSLYDYAKKVTQNEVAGAELTGQYRALQEVYNEGGAEGLINEIGKRNNIKSTGITYSDKVGTIYDERGQEGINLYQELKANAGTKKDEIKSYLDSRQDLTDADREYWFGKLSTAKNPYGSTAEETTANSNKPQQTTTHHYTKPDKSALTSNKGQWTADNNYGFSWDLTSSPSFARYQSIPNLSDYSPESYANIWHSMDADNSGSLTKGEITGYLDESNYSKKQKAGYFNAMARSNWSNPYQ